MYYCGVSMIADRIFLFIFLLIVLVFPLDIIADSYLKQDDESLNSNRHSKSSFRKPWYVEGSLRYENISDTEVREIQAVAKKISPGSIINIGGITMGCPCEDGPMCTEQVWVVAYRAEISTGIYLSKIKGHWVLGPKQKYRMEFDELYGPKGTPGRFLKGREWRYKNKDKLKRLYELKPNCDYLQEVQK